MSAIDTVIFDMDDVLCNYDCEARLDHMVRSLGLEREAIIEAIWASLATSNGRLYTSTRARSLMTAFEPLLRKTSWV